MPQPIFKRKAARTQKLRLRLPVAFSMDLERCKVLRRSMCFFMAELVLRMMLCHVSGAGGGFWSILVDSDAVGGFE